MVEPKYPGAVERYVNLGDCYDSAALAGLREDIMDSMSGYKGCYQRAYRCLGAAAELSEDMRAVLLTQSLSEKLAKRAQGILAREVRPQRGAAPGRVRQRFLGAVTHKGVLCLYDTALTQCERVYELADSCGLAHGLLMPILTGTLEAGYDAVACPDPMAPDRLAHLLIPQLGLAFLSSTPALPFPGAPYRRLRLDAAADQELLRCCRPRLRFAKKVAAALMEEAVASLTQAKAMHDDLEQIYNPHVDFERVHQTADQMAEEILSF